MKCSKCTFENPEGFAFCGKCGAKLVSVCSKCAFESPPGLKFCGHCGALLNGTASFTMADLDHLRAYMPSTLIEALRFDLPTPAPALLAQCSAHLLTLLNTLETLLPAYLVSEVIQNPQPGQIGGRFVEGTLLFADISGFTAMSEKLSRIGVEGAEELTGVVNRYFNAMLAILQAADGHLVKFGGDALLGLFLEPFSAARAVRAALEMQSAMADFSKMNTSQGVFPLRMKVGLHRGSFFSAWLGSTQRMEYALFGRAVNATAETESAAVAGQVLLDRATLDALESFCEVTPVANGDYFEVLHIGTCPLVEPSPRAASPLPRKLEPTMENLRHVVTLLDVLSPYLPAGLLGRIADEPHAMSLEGEHRLVSVLFANTIGLDAVVDRLGQGQESAIIAILNRYFTAMERSIHHYGGVINKIDLCENGVKLMAIFGAPVAHEDDAVRATRAACQMQAVLEEFQCFPLGQDGIVDEICLSQRIGVSYGYVFAGYVGSAWRHEYTVMGDEVNLAARLMSVALSQSTLVSSYVRQKVQALFDLQPHGSVMLKGKQDPVPVFSVEGVRAMPEPLRGLKGMHSPLVGRTEEWAQLLGAMEYLLKGRGQIVSVIGEAGLGKSRLVAEIQRRVAGNGHPAARWFEGRCLSYTESLSYLPFQDLLQKILGIQRSDTKSEIWEHLRDFATRFLSETEIVVTLPYLANFFGLDLDDALAEKVRYLDAEALRRRTFFAVSTLLSAYVRFEARPLVLVLEDLHWIDQASLDLLLYLMPLVDQVPLMLLMVYRPERERRCWEVHERAARDFAHCTTAISLQGLSPRESQQLLTNLVQISQWPEELQNLILQRTEGNPLYVEEMLRSLIEDGVLLQDEDVGWQIGNDLQSLRVPDTLQGVMMARLDRLDETCRWVAQVSAVVGRLFPFDVVAHVIDDGAQGLHPCLVRLQQHEIVIERQRSPELIYAFKHSLMQEVCYQSMLNRVRRTYHRKIAAYLEQAHMVGRVESERNVPLIAHHAFEGEDWPRALHYQLLAGKRSQSLFANREAIDHFERALTCTTQLATEDLADDQLSIHTALGELSVTTGQYDHAVTHLQEALVLAEARQDTDAEANLCRWLARVHELRGEYPPAFEWIERGLRALGEQETANRAELLLLAGLINMRRGNSEQAFARGQAGLAIAQKLGELVVLARAYNLLGIVTRFQGSGGEALDYFQQSFELHQQAGDMHGQAMAHNQFANAYFDMGRWDDADYHYRQARLIFQQIGDAYFCAVADNNLGGIAVPQGRLADALAFYQSALDGMEKIGSSVWLLGVLQMNLGHTYLRMRDVELTREHLQRCRDYFEQAQSRDFLPEMLRYFAKVALVAGDMDKAESDAHQGLDLAREMSTRSEEGNLLRVLGEVDIVKGAYVQAGAHLDEAIAILQEIGDVYATARAELSLAELKFRMGEQESGVAVLSHCVRVFEELGAVLDIERAGILRLNFDV